MRSDQPNLKLQVILNITRIIKQSHEMMLSQHPSPPPEHHNSKIQKDSIARGRRGGGIKRKGGVCVMAPYKTVTLVYTGVAEVR